MKQELDTILQEEQESLLQLSCYSIEGQLREGMIQGAFTLECDGKKLMKGKVMVSDPRMVCEPKSFQGEKVEISYCLDGSLVKEPEAISGSFMLVTNYGEYEITYCFKREKLSLISSMGEIKNLFHFTNLAKTNWQEALEIYFSPGFKEMLKSTQKEHLSLYRGLSSKKREQYMEEFLQAVHKKKPVFYELQENAILLRNIDTTYKEEVYIHKNGWGYTYLRVTTNGSFLTTEKEEIREEDFNGNVYKLPVYIEPNHLHQGKNWGEIILESCYETIRIPVQVYQNEHHRMRQALDKRRNAKWLSSNLTKLYMSFRSKNIAAAKFKKEGEEILKALQKSDDRNPLTKLYSAHLLISQDKYHEAKWLLDRSAKIIQEDRMPMVYAYYLYLMTLISEEEEYVGRVREEVEHLYYTHENTWQIAWLHMYLSKQLRQNAQKKWDFLKNIFQRGCISPVMYLEAALLLNYQPTLLMELGECEIRILRFAAKKDLLSEEVKGIIGYLAIKEKEYRKSLHQLLETLVIKQEREEFLKALCSILMKGNKIGPKYSIWYEKAILAEIKLTKLYEYYMASLDLNEEPDLPRMVLLYFSYQQEIEEEYGAYLYRYIHQNREYLEDLYLVYAPRMERYLLKKLYQGKINRDLGYLYENIFYPKMITEDNARALAKLIFYHKVSEENKKGKYLIVLHDQLKEEEIYQTADGLKKVKIYNKTCRLFWEDENQNRFVEKEEEPVVPYLKVKRMAEEIAKWVADEPGLAISFCDDHNGWQTMNWKVEAQFQFLSRSSLIKNSLRKELTGHLLDFYYENEALERLDLRLEQMTPASVLVKDRKKLIHYFMLRDFYHHAYEFIKEYGPGEMEPKILLRLSTYLLDEKLGEDKILSWYIFTAFEKGKYNVPMLKFLTEHYQGTSKKLRDIFYSAKDFEIETYSLSERILMQILFTRAYVGDEVEIFKSYVSGGAKTNIEAAFLTYRSLEYMRDDRIIDPYLIMDIGRVSKRGFRLPLVTRLAYLRYFAENKEENFKPMEELLQEFLEEIVIEKEMKLPFIQEYTWVKGMERLADRTTLSYKTEPKTRVMLHYRRIGKEEELVFKNEEMKEVYFGTYVKEFVLFYGEQIQYYITENMDNQEQLTESGTLSKEEIRESKRESRYQLINEMAIAAGMEDYSSLEQLLEEFLKKQYITEQVFF